MGLFSKSTKSQEETVDVGAPFRFRVDDVFTITGRGRLFTGIVEAGAVAIGAPATVIVSDRILLGQVRRLESRKRRKPAVLSEGEEGAIGLDSIETNDLPLRAYGGHMIVDSDSLKGAVIRSRQASDIPPAAAG
ncbi:elongation factor Tu [uncultured Corynebacterium sp.]|uniref:elongation factor Tu n=1 Tax=uncultured Corynebacterium sp. TaxID=159447 RepID=UPI0025CCFE09|nr:elongation factor Tu [uncultured Corynebacterium sp.]